MKNVLKTFGIVALVAIIGFSMVTCDMPDDNGGNNGGGNGGGYGGGNNTSQTPTAYDFTISGTGTVYFDYNLKTVTVTPKTSKTSGARTIYYEGIGSTEYAKTTEAPYFFGTYNVTFDVAAATGWNAASGLSAGTLTISDGTPNAPTGVTPAIASATSIKVSWTTVPRATSYKVFYIKEGMEKLSLAGTVTTNSFTHSGLSLKLDDIYFYYITAVNIYGESDYSTFKPLVIAKPVAPNAVTATATSSTGISLQWSAVTGATGYKVLYNITNSSSGGAILPDTYTSTSTPLTGAQANTTYYFWVKAINPFGESDYSTVTASVKTFSASSYSLGLQLTGDPIVASNGSALIQFQWYRTSNALDKFDVYYSVGSPDNFKFLESNGGLCIYTMFNASANTTYYFYVKHYPYNNGTFMNYEREGHSEILMVRTGSAPPPPPPTPPPPLPPAASSPPSGGSSGGKTCPKCMGDGECDFGSIIMGFCHGEGKLHDSNKVYGICPMCKGSGKCTRCDGKGKI